MKKTQHSIAGSVEPIWSEQVKNLQLKIPGMWYSILPINLPCALLHLLQQQVSTRSNELIRIKPPMVDNRLKQYKMRLILSTEVKVEVEGCEESTMAAAWCLAKRRQTMSSWNW